MRKNFTLLAWLVIIALIIYAVYSLSERFGSPDRKVDLSHATIVKEIKSLNRLETAEFTFEKIIDAGYQGNFFQNILYGDRILLIAHADVVAGFDMSKIKDENIKIKYASEPDDHPTGKGYWLTITLPPPEIFSTSLDNTRTKVYDRRTGILARSDKDLESEARVQAEVAIQNDACVAGILDKASENAEEQLSKLFYTLGFVNVSIIIPETSCK